MMSDENYLIRKEISRKKYFAFNIWDSNSAKAVINQCSSFKRVSFLQVPSSIYSSIDIEELVYIIRKYSNTKGIRSIIHLDHCRDVHLIEDSINYGFDSVMFDGSNTDLKENISITSKVVDYAKTFGVLVEGEIGNVVGNEGDIEVTEANKVTLEEIEEFVSKTEVDIVAIGIGTKHGVHSVGDNEIDFELVDKVNKLIDIPIAIHGGSGLGPSILRKLFDYKNICKINVSSDLKKTYYNSLVRLLNSDTNQLLNYDILNVIKHADKELEQIIASKLEILR